MTIALLAPFTLVLVLAWLGMALAVIHPHEH